MVLNTKKTFFLATFSLFLGVFAPIVSAATVPSTNSRGLTISPFILERQVHKGETLNETIEITNTTDRPLPIDISVNDFLPQGESGEQQFFEPGKGDPKFSLSSWITILNSPKLVLNPGEKTEVNFKLSPPLDAEDGGHYGAVIFSFQAGRASGSAAQVSQKLGAIILAKIGKAREDGVINHFTTNKSFYSSGPVDFKVGFHNTGNVHVKPRGSIAIYNIFGKKIQSVLVNEDGGNVLPQSERIFTSTWNEKFLIGHYTAKTELVYGDSGSVLNAETGFWVIPVGFIAEIAIGAIVLILLFSFAIRRYNRWLLRQYKHANSRK